MGTLHIHGSFPGDMGWSAVLVTLARYSPPCIKAPGSQRLRIPGLSHIPSAWGTRPDSSRQQHLVKTTNRMPGPLPSPWEIST